MSKLKFICAATVLALSLGVPMAVWADDEEPESPEANSTYSTVHQEGAVEWLFPLSHEQCNGIPSRYGTIAPDSNDRVAQTTTKVRANGSRKIDVLDVVTGTAVGNGSVSGTYIWVYENHAIYEVPSRDGPAKVKVRVVDSFRLFGNGLEREFSFDWRWRFEVPSARAFDPGLDFNGVTFPENEVNPTNVFNFKAFSTKGDPLNCDPI